MRTSFTKKPQKTNQTKRQQNKTEPKKGNRLLDQTPWEGESSQKDTREPRKYPTSHVPKVEDALVDGLWEELKQQKLEAQENKPPPLEEIDFD